MHTLQARDPVRRRCTLPHCPSASADVLTRHASAICALAGSDGRLRLADQTPIGSTAVLGRPEILAGGGWRVPCRDNLRSNGISDHAEAQVACRAVGYDGGGLLLPGVGPADAELDFLPIGFAQYYCNGKESTWSECFHVDSYSAQLYRPTSCKTFSQNGNLLVACSSVAPTGTIPIMDIVNWHGLTVSAPAASSAQPAKHAMIQLRDPGSCCSVRAVVLAAGTCTLALTPVRVLSQIAVRKR